MLLVRKDENDQLISSNKLRENPAACIFVANLNKNVQDQDLNMGIYHHFKQWGNVLGVKVLKDRLKRPYAFVQFESEEDTKSALKNAPGTFIHGRSIRCEPARVNRSICLISFGQPFNKMFLQNLLVNFGELEDVTVLQPQAGFHYAFIKYKYRNDAITAFLTLKKPENYAPWSVEWASNLDVSNMYRVGHMIMYRYLDRFSIFIGNLDVSTSKIDLRDEFQVYGKIQNIHLVSKTNSQQMKRKAFAFIKYESALSSAQAIEQENGKVWKNRVLCVCYREYYYHHTNPYALYNNDSSSNNNIISSVMNNKQMMINNNDNKRPSTNMTYFFMPYCAYYMGTEQQSSHTTTTTGTFYTRNEGYTTRATATTTRSPTTTTTQPYYTDPYIFYYS